MEEVKFTGVANTVQLALDEKMYVMGSGECWGHIDDHPGDVKPDNIIAAERKVIDDVVRELRGEEPRSQEHLDDLMLQALLQNGFKLKEPVKPDDTVWHGKLDWPGE